MGEDEVNISLNGRRMEEVGIYRYLGVDISNDSGIDEEVNHRIGEARRAWGALKDVWKKRHISREAKVGMYEGIIEPNLLYGCETWALNKKDRKRMEAVEMNCLRNICGRRRIDMVPNVVIKGMCGKNVGVSERMDQGVLRWFGHVERMGRPRKSWMNGVNETLGRKGLNIQEAKDSVQDRNGWRSICRGVV